MFANLMRLDNGLFDDFHGLQRDLESLFRPGVARNNIRAVAAGSFPTINVGSLPDSVRVLIFAPGLDPDQIDVSIQRNVLTIAGSRNAPERKPDEGAGYHLRERFDGAFRRAVALSDDVDPGQVEASYKNGILDIKVGKRETAVPRQISIKSV